MKLYIYLQMKPPQAIKFSSPFCEIFKSKGYHCLDADQDSEPYLITQGLAFLKEANEVVLHLSVQKGISLGKVAHFFEGLRKVKTLSIIICEGKNEEIKKTLKFLKRDVIYVSEEKEALSQFEHYFNSK